MTKPPIDREHGLYLLHQMLRIRRFEEKCSELYQKEKIRGFLHLYIGEEAIAAGAMGALEPDDAFFGTYREHAHALMRGVPAGEIMAEMYGKQEGCARGRGGSMHLFDLPRRFFGGSAIVGGHLPMAVGMAFADRQLGRDRVTACFFGEGAMAEGEFHEAMNLAALWSCPVVFCCENNRYAMGTALDRSESQTALTVKAASYDMPTESVDGMDPIACEHAMRAAVGAVREGIGPFFVEFRTYRFRAHSMFDAQRYRSRDEVEGWLEHDPLVVFPERLRGWGLLEDGDVEALEADVQREIDAAVAFAEEGTWEPVSALQRDVYTERPTPTDGGPR